MKDFQMRGEIPLYVSFESRIYHTGRVSLRAGSLGLCGRYDRTARFETAGLCIREDTPTASYQTTVTCILGLYNFDPLLQDTKNDY